ncbi:hypothetical protein SEA_POKYPUPPY_103 [Gordonia phage PokyPuppy]|nr:hypothetical protein SEA_POKYPUPPY_103 [Gordonia phage PokyPuppy]
MATFNKSPNHRWHLRAIEDLTETVADIDGSGDEAMLVGDYRLRGEPWRRSPDEGMYVHAQQSPDNGWNWHDVGAAVIVTRSQLSDPTLMHNTGVELIGRIVRAQYASELDARLAARDSYRP